MFTIFNFKYKYKVKNSLGQWNGRGNTSGTMGSLGNSTDQMYQYEILVHKKTWESKVFHSQGVNVNCEKINTGIRKNFNEIIWVSTSLEACNIIIQVMTLLFITSEGQFRSTLKS